MAANAITNVMLTCRCSSSPISIFCMSKLHGMTLHIAFLVHRVQGPVGPDPRSGSPPPQPPRRPSRISYFHTALLDRIRGVNTYWMLGGWVFSLSTPATTRGRVKARCLNVRVRTERTRRRIRPGKRKIQGLITKDELLMTRFAGTAAALIHWLIIHSMIDSLNLSIVYEMLIMANGRS